MGKKTLPVIPSLIVSDSVTLDEVSGKESFIYCPNLETEKINQFRQSYKRKTDDQYIFEKEYEITFERKHVKDLVHLITFELKSKGTKIPLLILPFRPLHHDEDLKKFLNKIFIAGIPISTTEAKEIIKITNAYILMSALKFIWCRLPGKAIIGWKSYTKFVKLEDTANFPDKAFLEFMPNCLSSGAHASIVYDFFDLIVAFVLNSKENLMSPKKLSKLCGLWAFSPVRNKIPGLPSYERGLYEWIPAGDAMFHLLLSFVKAMPPNGDLSKLPKVFQNLLKISEYPPLPTSSTLENSRQLQQIPIITIRSNNPSKNPAELLLRVGKTLKFDDPTIFYTREDFLLLKRLFKEKENVVNKLSSEGSRLLENLCLCDTDLINDGNDESKLKYKLIPGWSTNMTSKIGSTTIENKDFFTAVIGRVTIDDYFIWTWLASLGIEETDFKKQTFGKTYIMEVELAEGFKKWIVVEEQDLERDGYDIELEIKQEKLKQLEQKIQLAELEAKKIKKEALLQAEKLEIERHEARKLLEKKNLNDITNTVDKLDESLPPPPIPKKDYDEIELPQKSKSRKPPPKDYQQQNITKAATNHEIPKKSNKRNTKSKNMVDNDVIRISLPDLDADEAFDTFLQFETLGIDDIDVNYESFPRTSPTDEDHNKIATAEIESNKYNNSNIPNKPNNIPTRSPKRTNVLPTFTYENPVPQSLPLNLNVSNEITISTPRQTSPARQVNPMINNSPPRGRIQPRSAYPSDVSPNTNYLASSPNQNGYTSATNSPPRTVYPMSSSPKYRYPPVSPPTLKSSSPSPSRALPLFENSPGLVSSPELQKYVSAHSSPIQPQQRQYPGPTVYSEILGNDTKYDNENIPILIPPSSPDTPVRNERIIADKSPAQNDRILYDRSPVTKSQIQHGFDELENEFKDCLDQLDDEIIESTANESRKVSSGSRIRKAPPQILQSMKSSVNSESSSAYPPTHLEYSKQRSESPNYLSTSCSDHSRETSTQSAGSAFNYKAALSHASSNSQSYSNESPIKRINDRGHSLSPPSSSARQQQLSPKQEPNRQPINQQNQRQNQMKHLASLPVTYPPPIQYHPSMQYPYVPYPQGQFTSSPHLQQQPQMRPKSQAPPKQTYPSRSSNVQRISKPPKSGQNPSGYPIIPMGYQPLVNYPPGYPVTGYPMQPPIPGYPSYPVPYYPPLPHNASVPNMPPKGNGRYSNNVINHMPPSGKVDKLHGPQALNKKNARDAFMSDAFGI
jgi:hypothetical protein